MKLSAVVGADSFFYAIEDRKFGVVDTQVLHTEKPYALFKDPLDYLPEILASNTLFFESFKKITIGLADRPYLIISNKELKGQSAEILLRQNTLVAKDDRIFQQKLKELDSTCIFSVPKAMITDIELYFDSPKFVHVQGCLLEHLSKAVKKSKPLPIISLNWSANILNVSLWRKGKLRFQNHFVCKDALDVIYYLSAVLTEFNHKAEKCEYSFSGSQLSRMMENEVLKSLINERSSNLRSPKWVPESHFLLDLYAVSKCG